MGLTVAELFRETFRCWLENQPRGTQGNLADQIGIGRQHMSDFVNGRRMISEEKREELARKTGFASYVDFLRMGEDIFAEEIDWEPHPYIIQKGLDSPLRKERLKLIIESLENFSLQYEVDFTPEQKAALITDLYDSYMKSIVPEPENTEIEKQRIQEFILMKVA